MINMSSDKQQIAIAEACGWKPHADGVGFYRGFHPLIKGGEPAPDYLNDLNAMHEAEKVLTPQQKERYCTELLYTHSAMLVFSTAAQRAEAFLRTIGRWEDGK